MDRDNEAILWNAWVWDKDLLPLLRDHAYEYPEERMTFTPGIRPTPRERYTDRPAVEHSRPWGMG